MSLFTIKITLTFFEKYHLNVSVVFDRTLCCDFRNQYIWSLLFVQNC